VGIYRGRYWGSFREAAVAAWLDAEGIPYEYQPGPYPIGPRRYSPDFYLPDAGEWWEVRVRADEYMRQRTAAWHEAYPDRPLVIIDEAAARLKGIEYSDARRLYGLHLPDPLVLAA
jgi:hypothetical protein